MSMARDEHDAKLEIAAIMESLDNIGRNDVATWFTTTYRRVYGPTVGMTVNRSGSRVIDRLAKFLRETDPALLPMSGGEVFSLIPSIPKGSIESTLGVMVKGGILVRSSWCLRHHGPQCLALLAGAVNTGPSRPYLDMGALNTVGGVQYPCSSCANE